MHKHFIAVVIALLFSFALHSETLSGELKGRVTDSEGNPLKGANVTLNETGIQVRTDSEGYYSVLNVPFGHYHITYSMTGYITRTFGIEMQSEHIVKDIVLENSLIQTATIDVTGSFEVQEISQSTFSLSTLGPRELIQERSHNLSSTIDNIPGVNTLSTGMGIGKPVLRGMTSNSVLIIHDGVKQESQQWGDEHSPEVSTYDIDRIEILRGPASLLYGADGIGGVVNILSKPLLNSSGFKKIFYGNLDLGGFSVNKEATGNLTIGTGIRNMGLKGHLGFRKSGNVRTPDGNLLVNTLIPGVSDTIHGGILSNSGIEEVEGGLKTQNSNAATVPETSLNIDFGIRARLKNFSAEVSLFNNVINDVIFPSPAGTIDSSSGLPVFLISQDRAFFRGFEYSFQYQPLDFLLLTLSGDYVFTKK
ncbi:MAG TPA: TonB-dependent receptor [Ignavibacteria bacterium]|nr:TonB-dependent receptor [Ignavibacteria bacterium]